MAGEQSGIDDEGALAAAEGAAADDDDVKRPPALGFSGIDFADVVEQITAWMLRVKDVPSAVLDMCVSYGVSAVQTRP